MFDFTLSQDECEKIQKFKAETLNNFSKAYEDARNSKIEDTPSRKDNDIAIVEGTIETSLWNQAIAKWHSEGWAVDGFTENMYGLRADSNDNPGVIDIGFYDGHYYIQTTYLDDSDFAKSMKRKYKVGRRSYGSWWTFLSEPYYNIEEEQLLKTFNGNQAFQKYIVDYVDSLIADLKKYDRTAKWKKNLTANEDWSIYVMYLDLLVCDFTYEEEGNPYLDIKENEATGKG